MPDPQIVCCARAATDLFVLALYDLAVYECAELDGEAAPALFVRLPRALEAALLLEASLGGVFDFDFTADKRASNAIADTHARVARYRPRVRARYFLTEEDEPGTTPGAQVREQISDVLARDISGSKSVIADRLDACYDEWLGHARDPRCEVPDDDQLRELIRNNDRRNLPVLRFSVDLDQAGAGHRVQVAEALRGAGVASVAYSERRQPPPGFAQTGRLIGQTDAEGDSIQKYKPPRAFDVAAERFLKARDALGSIPTSIR